MEWGDVVANISLRGVPLSRVQVARCRAFYRAVPCFLGLASETTCTSASVGSSPSGAVSAGRTSTSSRAKLSS
eukprot:6053103-Lingulodinium_polyedra.AAC.1